MDEYREGELQDTYSGNRTMSSDDDRKRKNYKLIIDPVLEHGHSTKVYRFEGVIPGDPEPEPVVVSDPRSRIKRYWNKKDVLDIPVPRFKHDVYYVGTILPKEVSFSNLNDNINLDFLINMCKGFGNIEDSRIYYHPRNKKHLGIGKVVFASTRSAKLCADKLNQTSRMGMLINAVVDPFGKERTKWIDMATGEREKLQSFSPSQKSNQDLRGFQSKPSEATTTQKRTREKHQSRHILRGSEKESCSNSLKSESKDYTHNNIQIRELHQANYVGSEHKLNNLEISDSENFQSNTSSWSDVQDSNLKELHDTVKSDKNNQRRHERGSNYRHKYRDRHNKHYDHRDVCNRLKHRQRRENRHSGSKEQVNSTVNKHTEIENVTSDEKVVLNYEDVLPETCEAKSVDIKESEEPRMQSLESRIQSLLGGIGLSSPVTQEGYTAEDEKTQEELKDHGCPPLPLGPTPLPPDDPPLPDEAAPPPLPPEPQPHYAYSCVGNRMESKKTQLNIYLSNGHTLNTNKRNSGEEDDRMSLSSLGSEEEKIEVNPPTLESGLPPTQPPLPPLPPMPWQLPPPVDPVHNQAFQNQMSNSVYSQGLLGSSFKTVSHSSNLGQEEEVIEEMFVEVLDQVINQLKFIMRKDLCKKMVQDTAFTAYDRWWTLEQQCDKFTKPPESLLPVEIAAETSGTGLNTSVVFNNSATLDTFKQPTTGMSGTIEALFDNKDGTGFGVGGLLGLPKGVPKMPSFRKKFLKPITPPPDDDDDDDDDGNDSDEHEFLGPRTPEESESDDKTSDTGEESLSEAELTAFTEQRKKSVAIYSTDSDSDEEESEGSESDEEEEPQDRSETDDSESSDVDIETTSIQPPSPMLPPDASEQIDSRQKRKPEVPENESQEIERATFPVLCEQSSEDDSFAEESFTAVKVNNQVELPSFGIRGSFPGRYQQQQVGDERTRKGIQLPVRDNSETLQELLEKQLEKQRHFANVVSVDHCYHFKEEPKKRPRDPLPVFPQEDSDLTDSASEGEPDMIPCLPANLALDHQYCAIYHPIDYALQYQKYRSKIMGKKFDPSDFFSEVERVSVTDIAYETEIATDEVFKKYVNRTKSRKALADVTNLKGSRELMSLLPPEVAKKPKFKTRSFQEQQQFTYEFLYNGIDQEDINFLKRRYDELLQDDSPQTAWLNNVHWVEHSLTKVPDQPSKKRFRTELRKHVSGCARTEGYYKISHREKSVYLSGARGVNAYHTEEQSQESILWQLDKGRKQKAQQMREARSESRRWQTVLSSTGEDVGDLVKFNQLKFRKKALKFAKSGIHDWGLFALEPIASDEMVIEYVGQTIRQSTADLREKKYEQMGIGSSYMFRIDGDNIIDATKCGNLARFINHSCMPNCYAKIISVEGQKKIVIYSKTEIGVNEEITYDYKFPLEDEKIPCLCGTSACRGSLN